MIQLFPNLAWMNLQRRRQLQQLLAVLRSQAIPYRWGFPISLIATRDGKSSTLRFPAELSAFCNSLGVDQPPLPEWEKGIPPLAPADLSPGKAEKEKTSI